MSASHRYYRAGNVSFLPGSRHPLCVDEVVVCVSVCVCSVCAIQSAILIARVEIFAMAAAECSLLVFEFEVSSTLAKVALFCINGRLLYFISCYFFWICAFVIHTELK